jgi:hypothetical protein
VICRDNQTPERSGLLSHGVRSQRRCCGVFDHELAQLGGCEQRHRTDLVGANKGCRSRLIGLGHIRVGQRSFSLIPPFNAFVEARHVLGSFKQRQRTQRSFASAYGQVQRTIGQFVICEQDAYLGTRSKSDLLGCQKKSIACSAASWNAASPVQD